MFTDVAQQNDISASQLVDATGCSRSTAHRWLSGEHCPDYTDLHNICRSRAITTRQRLAILQDLANGDFTVLPRGEEVTGDINRDGTCDMRDVLEGARRTLVEASEALDATLAPSQAPYIDRPTALSITSALADAKTAINETMAAVQQNTVDRKQARPLSPPSTFKLRNGSER